MLSSLRWRLVTGTVLGTAAVYTLAALIIYSAIRDSLLTEFDASLETTARALVVMTEQDHQGVRLELDPSQKNVFAPGENNERFAVLAPDGRMLIRSGSADSADADAWWTAIKPGDTELSSGHARLPGGGRARYVALRFTPRWEDADQPSPRAGEQQAVILLLAGSAAVLWGKLRGLAWLLGATFCVTTLVTAALMIWIIGRGLRPLTALAGNIQQIGNDDLSRRVVAGAQIAETRPVVRRLNELLERLEASFSRERSFTADVAHELRTPLAALTAALEVAASRPRQPAEYEQTLNQCLTVTRSMGSMVQNLLTLARADARQINTQRQTVDLSAAARVAWQPFAPRAASREIKLQWSDSAGASAQTDPALLALVLANLYDNAVSYCDIGGTIGITTQSDANCATICVANTGSDIPADQAELVFSRFWRGDTARSQTGLHCGLGLALCQRIVTLLGGTIAVATVQGGRFAVTVELPSSV